MTIRIIGTLALAIAVYGTSFCGDTLAKAEPKNSAEVGGELTPEVRKQMAVAHRNMAACLEDPGKDFKDCHKQMRETMKKSCPTCSMMGRHHGHQHSDDDRAGE